MWMAAKEMRAKLTEVTGEPAWRPSTFLEQGMTDVKSALDVARIYGAALEDDLPFDGGALPRRRSSSSTSRRAQRKIAAYYRLDPDGGAPATWFEHWRAGSTSTGPSWSSSRSTKPSSTAGALLDAYDAASAPFNHAAALVGYAPDGFLIRSTLGQRLGRATATSSPPRTTSTRSAAESYGVVV